MTNFSGYETEAVISSLIRRTTCFLHWVTEDGLHQQGTGTVVKLGGRPFIATCHHIVERFLNAPEAAAYFEATSTSMSGNEFYWANSNASTELGLMAFESEGDSPNVWLTEEHLLPVRDVSDVTGSDFFLYGYPEEMTAWVPGRGIYPAPFGFSTRLVAGRHPESGFLTLAFAGPNGVVTSSGRDLPSSGGLSGSLIIELSSDSSRQLQVVAMEFGNDGPDIYASGIGHLLDLIPEG